MLVTEIRNAVVETIEFIIPPIVKLIIVLFIANYITYGQFNAYLGGAVDNGFKSINIPQIKAAIDNLYLSSVVPIIAILLLITMAYVVDRGIGFVGSIVPITLHTTSDPKDKNQTVEIWSYLPEIKNIHQLQIKIDQLFSVAQSTHAALPLEQVKWQEEKRKKNFQKISFCKFLFMWSIACYLFIIKHLSIPLATNRLWLMLFVMVILIIAFYFQVIKKELEIQQSKLMIVAAFLKLDPTYANNENREATIRKEHEMQFDSIAQHRKRWWWLSVGYRTDWLMMYKYYRLKIPFSKYFGNWKIKKAKRS